MAQDPSQTPEQPDTESTAVQPESPESLESQPVDTASPEVSEVTGDAEVEQGDTASPGVPEVVGDAEPAVAEAATAISDATSSPLEVAGATEPEVAAVPLTPPSPTVSKAASSRVPQNRTPKSSPSFKVRIIQVLRVTIRLLEGLADALEAEPSAKQVEKAATGPSLTDTVRTTIARVTPTLTHVWETGQTAGQRLQAWWIPTLRQIRAYLPASLNQTLSDRALTGAIAGLLVVLLWILPGVFSRKPQPTDLATAPSVSDTDAEEIEVTVPVTASPAPGVSPSPRAEERRPEKPPAIAVSPSPLPSLAPSPVPSPPLKLTPEQKLIAAIQDQVAEISNQYVSGLIQSVQANFRSSRLTIKLGTGWYELSQGQQDKLANEMLRRTRELDFSKLEMTDAEGSLLGRSPVVGTEMVILKRVQSAEQPA